MKRIGTTLHGNIIVELSQAEFDALELTIVPKRALESASIPTAPVMPEEPRKARVVESGYSIPSHSKGRKSTIRVTLSNGRVIQKDTASESFALVIEYFGIEQVKALGLRLNNSPLVDTKKHATYNTFQVDRYFIMTHSNTDTKVELLQTIARKLGKTIDVKIV